MCLNSRNNPPTVKNTDPQTHKLSTFKNTSALSISCQSIIVPTAKNHAPVPAPPSTPNEVNESLLAKMPPFPLAPILAHFHIYERPMNTDPIMKPHTPGIGDYSNISGKNPIEPTT